MNQNPHPTTGEDAAALAARRTRKRYLRKHHPKGWRKTLRDLRYRLEYLGFLGVRGLLRMLGLEQSSRLSGAIWRHIAPHTSRHTRALRHLALAFPEKSDAERETIARSMWDNLGQVMGEALLLDHIIADPDRVRLADEQALEPIHRTGGQGVVVSMHYGNWELVSCPAGAQGFKLAGAYQRVLNPLIEQAVIKMRQPIYFGGLHSKGTGAAGRLMDWVREGNLIGVLADQRHVRGIDVPFFGHPAPSNTFPAMVARHLGVPLLAARTLRGEKVHFEVEAVEIPVPQTDDKDADIAAATAAIHATFERWIRERPDQWMWAHRRWG
ncbi:lauroyl acyltransferase [Agaricicola taiwanensis]|uniref:Lauroyl acyltransferase n=1 Tax=Agaricicola taiwanensis TaxID=591372 RepID=A0A8J3DW73_9RHOB|nr:lauroyl acyltransferase [Agaricicola taiwanensis]GGE45817.1 lauroyl acyltransferase [Agaricicola taiwanensis]